VLIDPGALTDPEDYLRRVAEFSDAIRATRPVHGAAAVRVPFDRSAARRQEALRRDALDVPDAVIAALRHEAGRAVHPSVREATV
jgi:LDH2 family malate/lactate/ureidoglycolate dehydrogenase